MKLYMVVEVNDDFQYFYGVFSSFERADHVRNVLELSDIDNIGNYEIREIMLDQPTELYYFVTED